MKRFLLCLSLLIFSAFTAFVSPATAQDPVVRAVLFYSPTCPHCHKVITEDLPVLLAMFNTELEWVYLPTEDSLGPDELPSVVGAIGDKLQILYVNVASAVGNELFWATLDRFEAQDSTGVPNLTVDGTMLFGSADIPAQFPGIIEQGLAQGGIDWPDVPGLTVLLSQMIPFPTPEPTPEGIASPTEASETVTPGQTLLATRSPQTATPSSMINFEQQEPTVMDKIKSDLVGNIISIVVLVGMIVTFFVALIRVVQQTAPQTSDQLSVVIPLLAVVGLFIAAYLTFVETSGAEAVCGPVGDCNTVQQSKYAMLFGVIPVGALGIAGYLLILGTWFVARLSKDRLSDLTIVVIFGMATFGTIFSIYLTFLEPFVIGATCAWCLTSAIVTTVIFWFTADPMADALDRL